MVAFLFDKKSLAMLAAAALVLSGLLFGSGFLLGVQWGLPAAADEMAARQLPLAGASAPAAAPAASTEPAATEPLASEPIAIEPATPAPAAPPVATPPAAPSQPAAPAPGASVSQMAEPAAVPTSAATPTPPEGEAAASDPAPAALSAAAEAPAPTAPPAPAPAAQAPAPRAATAVAATVAAPAEPAFSLQVGAFAHRENCDAAVAALASHGYQPYVVDLAGRSRVLHTVRIGRYEDREAATQALAEFRHKERQPAVILPPGS